MLKAAEYADSAAQLVELAYGWDTAEVGEARREVRA